MKQLSLLLISTLLSTASVANSNHSSIQRDATLDALRNAFKTQQTAQTHHDSLAIIYGGADVALDENSKAQFIPV